MELVNNGTTKIIVNEAKARIENEGNNHFEINSDCKPTRTIAAEWTFNKTEHFSKLYALCFSMAIIPTMTIAMLRGDVSPYMPYISETACKPPSSTIFTIFMTCSAFLYAIDIVINYVLMSSFISDKDGPNKWCNRFFLLAGLLSAVGMFIVTHNSVTSSPIWHFGGAILIFGDGPVAGGLLTLLSYKLSPVFYSVKIFRIRLVSSILATICTVTMMVTAITGFSRYASQISPYLWAGNKTPIDEGFYFLITSSGCQYIISLLSIFFHLSMGLDMKKYKWCFKFAFCFKATKGEQQEEEKRYGWTSIKIEYLPKTFIVCFILAIIPTSIIAVARGDVTIFAPLISEAASDPPQSWIYSTFFSILSILVVPAVTLELVFHSLCANHKGLPPWFWRVVISSGITASFGFLIIAAFTMRNYFVMHVIGSLMVYQLPVIGGILFTWLQYYHLDHHPDIFSIRKQRLSCFVGFMTIGTLLSLTCSTGIWKFGKWTDDHWTGNRTIEDEGFYLLFISGTTQFLTTIFVVLHYWTLAQQLKKIDAFFKLSIIHKEKKID